MFNIFAEALLIAIQMGRPSVQADRKHRRFPKEFQDIEAWNSVKRSEKRDR